MEQFEIYVHLPFCIKKCSYCDFLSFPAEKEQQRLYVDALLREIRRTGERITASKNTRYAATRSEGLCNISYNAARILCSESELKSSQQEVSSVFFGGGTPSVLPAEWISEILGELRRQFLIGADAEITIETNPGTVDAGKLQMYRAVGINRISFGCQSFQDEELKLLGRIHTVREIKESVQLAREAGFANINLDLMSGLPGQTLSSWEDTLRQAIALQPEHISAYSLIIEEETPFFALYGEEDEQPVRADAGGREAAQHVGTECGGRSNLPLPDEESERRMYERTGEILTEAGYRQYEISNYAKEGYVCRHNLGYWTGVPYIGFGLGASGYLPYSCFDSIQGNKDGRQLLSMGAEPDSSDNQTDPAEAQAGGHFSGAYGKLQWLRYRNTCNIQEYINSTGEFDEFQQLDTNDLQAEFMILGLRLTEGVEDAEFERRFGCTLDSVYGTVLDTYTRLGFLVREKGMTRFSPKGVSVSNTILAEFL